MLFGREPDLNRCKNMLSGCQALRGGTELPFAQWDDMLSGTNGGNTNPYLQGLRALIVALADLEASIVEMTTSLDASALAGTIALLQSTLEQLESVSVVQEGSGITANQFNFDPINQFFDFILNTFGLDLRFLSSIFGDIQAGFSQGIGQAIGAFKSALMALILVLLEGLSYAIFAPGSARIDAGICLGDLVGCEYDRFVVDVIPALVGEAVIASGFLTSEPEKVTEETSP